MNKKQKKEIKRNIDNEEYIEQNSELVFKKLIYNPLLRTLGLLILLTFSLINNERIIRLTALTSNAIFSNEFILGHITYYTILGVTIGSCLIVSLGSLIVKSNIDFSSIVVLRKAYHFYSFYDMVIFVLSTFVCLFFIIMILITPCNISGSSMEDTYYEGDRVLLWNIGYQPQDGDVVVFDSQKYIHQYSNETRFFIKRVVAKEGDKISFKVFDFSGGHLFVNDQEVEYLYVSEFKTICASIGLHYSVEFIMPNDKVMVLGDNRAVSLDSRKLGLIDESEIVGKVLFRFYPFNKIGNPEPNIK